MDKYDEMDEWLEEDEYFAKIVAESFSKSEEEVVEIKPMYDVKGNKIELVHDFELGDIVLGGFKSIVKKHGMKQYVDNYQSGSKSKNIKIQMGVLDYLIDEGRFQEFIDALPEAESLTIELEEVKPTQDATKLIKLERMLRDKNISMYIVRGLDSNTLYRLDDVLFAGKQLDDWANEINSATVDGKSLSPLEKFIYAYMIVQNRVGKECEFNAKLSRDPIAILNNDYCVCVGYASLLNELCSRIGIQCTDKSVGVPGWHAINCSIIKDDKYGVNGLYYSDPTRDRKDLGNTLFACLLPSVEDVFDLYFKNRDKCTELDDMGLGEKELFPNEESLKQAQQDTKKIDYTIMSNALTAVFKSKGKTRKDADKYLHSSFDKVRENQDSYKGHWMYDLLKAMGKIPEQNINRS